MVKKLDKKIWVSIIFIIVCILFNLVQFAFIERVSHENDSLKEENRSLLDAGQAQDQFLDQLREQVQVQDSQLNVCMQASGKQENYVSEMLYYKDSLNECQKNLGQVIKDRDACTENDSQALVDSRTYSESNRIDAINCSTELDKTKDSYAECQREINICNARLDYVRSQCEPK